MSMSRSKKAVKLTDSRNLLIATLEQCMQDSKAHGQEPLEAAKSGRFVVTKRHRLVTKVTPKLKKMLEDAGLPVHETMQVEINAQFFTMSKSEVSE